MNGVSSSSIAVLILVVFLLATIPSDISAEIETEGPWIDEIIFYLNLSEEERSSRLKVGNVDLDGEWVDFSLLNEYSDTASVDVKSTLRNGYSYLSINCAKYPLNISEFRRALALAMNKTHLANDRLQGYVVPLDTSLPQDNPFSLDFSGYFDSELPAAIQLLDSAGFIDVDEDGFREAPDGSEFSITLEVYAGSESSIAAGEEAISALQSLGVECTLVLDNTGNLLNRLRFHGDYDIAFYWFDFENWDIDWLAYEFWSEYADETYYNTPNFRNSSYDDAREIILHSLSIEEIDEAAREIQRILLQESPIIVLYQRIRYSAYNDARLDGWVVEPNDGLYNWWTLFQVRPKNDSVFQDESKMKVALPGTIYFFNFMINSQPQSKPILDSLYASLLVRDPEGNLRPWIAKDWSIQTHDDGPNISEGFMQVQFILEDNVTWSDGNLLTTEDVAFSFEYYLADLENPASHGLEDIINISIIDEYQIIIEFNSTSFWHLGHLAEKPILPMHVFEDLSPEEWNLWSPNPLGSDFVTAGPFIVADFRQDTRLVLVKNPNFFLKPSIETVNGDGGFGMIISGVLAGCLIVLTITLIEKYRRKARN